MEEENPEQRSGPLSGEPDACSTGRPSGGSTTRAAGASAGRRAGARAVEKPDWTPETEWVQWGIRFLHRYMSKTLATRFFVLMLLGLGYGEKQVQELVQCSLTNVYNVQNARKSRSPDAIMTMLSGGGVPSPLDAHTGDIRRAIRTGVCRTYADVVEMMQTRFNIRTSVDAVKRFCQRNSVRMPQPGLQESRREKDRGPEEKAPEEGMSEGGTEDGAEDRQTGAAG